MNDVWWRNSKYLISSYGYGKTNPTFLYNSCLLIKRIYNTRCEYSIVPVLYWYYWVIFITSSNDWNIILEIFLWHYEGIFQIQGQTVFHWMVCFFDLLIFRILLSLGPNFIFYPSPGCVCVVLLGSMAVLSTYVG